MKRVWKIAGYAFFVVGVIVVIGIIVGTIDLVVQLQQPIRPTGFDIK